ncbi:MAG: hypothetical protein ACRDPD_24065 [Streptosporangiaceae bacterium]
MTPIDGPELLRIIGVGLVGVPFEVPVPTDPAGAFVSWVRSGDGQRTAPTSASCSGVLAFPACRATRTLDTEAVRAR